VEGIRQVTAKEALLVALGAVILLVVEVLVSAPRILFTRYLSLDELWTKFVDSGPGIWGSIVQLEHSGDPTPPLYHILARASWAIVGGTGEAAFRGLSFVATMIALVMTYAVLRRSFAILPTLIAVLALWSCPLVIRLAFCARPYGLLLAATAAFSLLFATEDLGLGALFLVAISSVAVCTVHYFGVFGLAAIVLGDTLTCRAPRRSRLRRLLAASAGPLTLIACAPFLYGQTEGFSHLSYLGPLSADTAFNTLVEMLGIPMLIAAGLIVAWWITELDRSGRVSSKDLPDWNRSRPPLHRVAGFSALLLVPVMVIVLSILYKNATLDRYMITALLGFTVLLAMLASQLPSPLLTVTAVVVLLVGGWNVRMTGKEMADSQIGEEAMVNRCVALANDGLPIVTLSPREAYILFEYAPRIRPLVFVADLRTDYNAQLSLLALNGYELTAKWDTVQPDLPRLANLDELRQMGQFHLVEHTEGDILTAGLLPFQIVSGSGWDAVYRLNI
jgi:uncharacterized membrane protein